MSLKTLTLILISLFSIASQGANFRSPGDSVDEELSAYFHGDLFNGDSGESLRIMRDHITISQFRQVGSDDNKEVPEPTVCKYILSGWLYNLSFKSDYSQKKTPDVFYEMTYIVTSGSILPINGTISHDCQNYINQINERISKSNLAYTVEFEILGDNKIRLHTSGSRPTGKRELRHEGSLDEIFLRKIDRPDSKSGLHLSPE